jgi:hypothetical protein
LTQLNTKIIHVFVLLIVLCTKGVVHAQSMTGRVLDAESGEILIGAQIFVLPGRFGTITNSEGLFHLTNVSESDTLIIQYIGYQTNRIFPVRKMNRIQLFQLEPETIHGEDVLVVASATDLARQKPGAVTLNPVEMARLPSFLGQRDVFKSLQFFPGVVQGAEGSAGIYIRGGGMDQTQVLLDGIPMYQLQHAGGFTSAIHPDALQASTLLTGGFPASYGGRLGSVLDLRLKSGNENNTHVSFNLGAVTADGFVETPLVKEKLTVIAGGRIATLPYTLKAFSQDFQNAVPSADFDDVLAKLTWKPVHNHRVEFLVARTHDQFGNNQVLDRSFLSQSGVNMNSYRDTRFGLNWGNEVSGVRYTTSPSSDLLIKAGIWRTAYNSTNSEFTDFISRANGKVEDRNVRDQRLKSGVTQKAAYADLLWRITDHIAFETGLIATEGDFFTEVLQRFSSAPDGKLPAITGTPDRTAQSERAWYVSTRFDLAKKRILETGIRGQRVQAGDMYSANLILPRFSYTHPLPNGLTMKASAAKMVQTVHALLNGTTGINTDLWIPVTHSAPMATGWTYASGANLPLKRGLDLSFEVYWRTMNNLVEYKEGAHFMGTNATWQGQTTTGKGDVKGMELYVRKSTGRITGMSSFSISSSKRDFEDLNQGRTYRFKYDRPIVMSTFVQYKLTKVTSLSVTFTAFSGQLVSLPMYSGFTFGFVHTGTESRPHYSANAIQLRNNYRLPAYHRSDIAFHHQFGRGRIKTDIRWGVYNLYNRWNVSHVTLYDVPSNFKQQEIRLQPTYLFPITPFFSWGVRI